MAPGLYRGDTHLGRSGPHPSVHYLAHRLTYQGPYFAPQFEQFHPVVSPPVLATDGPRFGLAPPSFIGAHPRTVPHGLPPPPLPPPPPVSVNSGANIQPGTPSPSSPRTSLSGVHGNERRQHDRLSCRKNAGPPPAKTKISPRIPIGPPTALLYAFKNTQDRVWTLRELRGHVKEFATDQYGSKFIQEAIVTADGSDIDLVYDEIIGYSVVDISKDVFGNYVVQRILDHGTDIHKAAILCGLKGHLRDLSLHIYGCRVVQKLLDVATAGQQGEVVKEIERYIPECVQSAHGNHVVQKILEVVPPNYLPNFIGIFRRRVIEFARHSFGCRVIQRCFQHLPLSQAQPLLNEFMERAFAMITDQFGNYVVQHLLEFGGPNERDYIISLMRGNIIPFALHKHASNVCEKALVHSSPRIQQDLIDEMLILDHNHFPRGIFTLVHDPYGNYVLQRAVQQARGRQKDYLISVVAQQLRNARVPIAGPRKDECVKYLAIDRTLRKYRDYSPTV